MAEPVPWLVRVAEQCTRAREASLPYLAPDTVTVCRDGERLMNAIVEDWVVGVNFQSGNKNMAREDAAYSCPSMNADQYEVEEIGHAMNDSVMATIAQLEVAMRPQWRNSPLPNETDAIAIMDEMRRRVRLMATHWDEAMEGGEELRRQCYRVLVYYASHGYVTFLQETSEDDLRKARMDPSRVQDEEKKRSKLPPVMLEMQARRLKMIAKKVQLQRERIAKGGSMEVDDRRTRRLLFHPAVFASICTRYFYPQLYTSALLGLHRGQMDEPTAHMLRYEEAMARSMDAARSEFFVSEYTLDQLQAAHAMKELGTMAVETELRRKPYQKRKLLSVFDVWISQFEDAEQSKIRARFREEVLSCEKKREVSWDRSPAWEILAWWRMVYYRARYNFYQRHIVFQSDLVNEEARVLDTWLGMTPRNPIILQMRGHWWVQTPLEDVGSRGIVRCPGGFRQALTVWVGFMLEDPHNGRLSTDEERAGAFRTILGLQKSESAEEAAEGTWADAMEARLLALCQQREAPQARDQLYAQRREQYREDLEDDDDDDGSKRDVRHGADEDLEPLRFHVGDLVAPTAEALDRVFD